MNGLSLHDFISRNREEILALSIAGMKESSPGRSDQELAADFDVVLDELIGALADADAPEQGQAGIMKSGAAAKVGSQRQLRAYEIEKLPLHFGSISVAVGELGARLDLSFSAREYKVFNQCIDNFISSAIEQYSNQAWKEQEDQATQRIGFFAHELRNALGSARMSYAILKRGELGINSKTGDVLERSLGRLENLVSQTLVAIQLQAGLPLERTRISVCGLLRSMAETVVPERGIRVVVEADDALEIEADERLLVSAVSNLLQNAFKFTKSDGHILLRAYRASEHVMIEVEDECGGLPPGREEELFEPYVRRGANKSGLGLGLAITREAIEKHGGQISVRNLPGKGCVFNVLIRAREPEAERGHP